MKFFPVAQGSASWYELRLGRPTASNFHKIVTPGGKASAQAPKYLYRLVAERLLHDTMDDQIGYVQWVEWGKANEGHAVAQFEFTHEMQLEPGGLVMTDDGRLAASPDRIYRKREGVEIKCPAPWTMVEYLLDGPGDDYRPQVQGQMLVGEFIGVHFYAYHPQMPAYHKVTLPDPNYQAVLRSALNMFCDALDVATERAKAIGAYAVTRRLQTPAEVAFDADRDVELKIVNPENEK